MSKSALKRISNLNADDLFLSFDADEIPSQEVRPHLIKFNIPTAFTKVHFRATSTCTAAPAWYSAEYRGRVFDPL